jgi:hypothetical protein
MPCDRSNELPCFVNGKKCISRVIRFSREISCIVLLMMILITVKKEVCPKQVLLV